MLRLPSLWNGSQPEPQESPANIFNPARHGPQAHWNWNPSHRQRRDWFAASPQKLAARRMRESNVNKIAKSCGLTPQTIFNVLDGKTWPDLATIARLEVSFPPQAVGQRAPQDA